MFVGCASLPHNIDKKKSVLENIRQGIVSIEFRIILIKVSSTKNCTTIFVFLEQLTHKSPNIP